MLPETDTVQEIVTETRDEKKAKASTATGIAPEKFQGIHFKLDVLRKQGLLIDLNITGTGMFSKAASWADLGIADIEEDKRSTQFTRGQKILIPDGMVKRLKSVKARMSQALERTSYKITGFALYRWLPFTVYASFKAEWENLMVEFAEVKAEIISDRSKYVDEMAVLYTEIAEASWKSITA